MTAEHMIVHRDDFIGQARAALISQDNDLHRPRVSAYVSALASGGKVIEDLILSVFFGLDFELAVGAQRDRWGRLLGELRGGLSEHRYEAYQGFRITVHTTDATVPKMLDLLDEMFNPKIVVAYALHPNCVKYWVVGGAFLEDNERGHADQLFRDYQPAGACWPVLERPSTPYTFDTPFDESDGTFLSQVIFGGR